MTALKAAYDQVGIYITQQMLLRLTHDPLAGWNWLDYQMGTGRIEPMPGSLAHITTVPVSGGTANPSY